MALDRILVAIDESDASDRAFVKALEFAHLADAHLTALALEGPLPRYAATIGEVETAARDKGDRFGALGELARVRGELAGIDIDVQLRAGRTAALISQVAGEGRYDLVVLGRRRYSVRDWLGGATVERVAKRAGCPVMIVR
jgi:nucleotide-binding universal stress UspA family protein